LIREGRTQQRRGVMKTRFVLPPAVAAVLFLQAGAGFGYTPLVVERHRLANGLVVLLHEDHSVPVVNLNIRYLVGSRDEASGKTGLAHLVEHLMFDGSADFPGDRFEEQIEAMGGMKNADTGFDHTQYFETVPSQDLEKTLRLEAGRMVYFGKGLSEESFQAERETVKNEKLQYEDKPYGSEEEILTEAVFGEGHPYGHPVLGSKEDLDGLTLDDAKKFQRAFYRPNNAILTLSGDLNPEEALGLVKRIFGPIAGHRVPRRALFSSGRMAREVEKTVIDPWARRPLVMMAFRVPGRDKPGREALEALAEVLRSRLQKSPLIESPSVWLMGSQANDILCIQVHPAEGMSAETAASTIGAEIAMLVLGGVREDDLAGIKHWRLVSYEDSLQSAQKLASRLGENQALFRDPVHMEKENRAVLALKPRAVWRAAFRWLNPNRAAVVFFVPKDGGDNR
jgi:zinc protease